MKHLNHEQWLPEEDAVLRMFAESHDIENIASLTRRTPQQVRQRLLALGVHPLTAGFMAHVLEKTDQPAQPTSKSRQGRKVKTGMKSSTTVARARGGKRQDLGGVYFRSAWEANYARYLNYIQSHHQIRAWEFEPQVFVFEGVRRGALSYTPDFKVFETTGDYTWREIKGWMDSRSRTKIKRFQKYYPDEAGRLLIVDKDGYQAIAAYAALIPGWEYE